MTASGAGAIVPGEMVMVARLSAGLGEELAARYGAVDGIARANPARVRVLVTSGGVGADRALIEQLPALGLIAVFGVGLDRVDLPAARARGIAVTHTPDVLTDDVADLAVGLLYAAARQIPANDRFVRSGAWAAGGHAPFGRRVTGRRIGIVGLGRIGRAIARRLEPVAGMLAYHNRRPVAGAPYRYHPSAEALAATCDTLVVAASTVAGEPPLVTAGVLEALGPDGILINVARGGAVDEEALAAALAEGRLLAAGLDVFAREPEVHPALLASERAVLQPHMGSATPETRAAMAELVLANIAAWEQGAPLPSPASPVG